MDLFKVVRERFSGTKCCSDLNKGRLRTTGYRNQRGGRLEESGQFLLSYPEETEPTPRADPGIFTGFINSVPEASIDRALVHSLLIPIFSSVWIFSMLWDLSPHSDSRYLRAKLAKTTFQFYFIVLGTQLEVQQRMNLPFPNCAELTFFVSSEDLGREQASVLLFSYSTNSGGQKPIARTTICKKKCRVPCLKIIKNFRMVTLGH